MENMENKDVEEGVAYLKIMVDSAIALIRPWKVALIATNVVWAVAFIVVKRKGWVAR